MTLLKHSLSLFVLSMLIMSPGMAQKAIYASNGGLAIGFGAGTAFQRSDLANSKGLGFDFILGSQLYKKENALLSIDWKFRFLGGENKAYDHRINPDNTFSNIRYSFFSYDLELGLTLNRLRERTRIVVGGFAGAGITHGRTFTDLFDAGNNLYDFSGIDPDRESKLVYDDLITLSDGDFETQLVNKAALLPTAGIFLGYQISRSLVVGIEFKTNLYLSENNSFAGIDLDGRAISGSGIDLNNYATAGFRWSLGRGPSYSQATGNYATNLNNNYPDHNANTLPDPSTARTRKGGVPVSLPSPSVIITSPYEDYYQTDSYSLTLRATVDHVSGPENISFFQNGYPNNRFAYNSNTKIFTANVRLRDGENRFRIKAANQTSFAEDSVILAFINAPEIIKAAPAAEFTSPWQSQVTSSSDRIEVTASVKNVDSKQDIQFTLDGRNIAFEYFPATGLVKTEVLLVEGDNNLLIKGSSESGSAQDQLTVNFKTPENPSLPAVRFVHPSAPENVDQQRFALTAETQNVRTRYNITLKLNGTPINNFSFSPDGEVTASLLLSEGVNTLEITAKNEAGSAADQSSVTYNQRLVRRSLPVINIISPSTSPVITNQQFEELRATVLNVHSKEDITLNINGFNTRRFNFSSTTKLLSTEVTLREGRNIISIHAQNESGGDIKDQEFIRESRPCPLPVIRMIVPARELNTTDQQIYAFRAEVDYVTSNQQLLLQVNGNPLPFSFSNNLVSSSVPLIGGINTLSLSARNECGEDHASTRINYRHEKPAEPCTPPTVSFTLLEVNWQNATHELRGSVSGVNIRGGISLTVNGRADNGFNFVPATGALSARFKLAPGSHTIVVSATNACGADSQRASIDLEEPCIPPKVSFTISEVNRDDATHELSGAVTGVKNKADISFTVNGRRFTGFQFVPSTGNLSAKAKLMPGSHTIVVTVNNACGSDSKRFTVDLEEPCSLPTVSFTINEVKRDDATHALRGSVTGVKNKAEISLTVDGRASNGFQYVPATGVLSATFKLTPGSHTVVVSASNSCGKDAKSEKVTVDEEACGIRLNPGNSPWQFCLVTPSGTFTRDNLANANFNYSGPATSLFFQPIGGGGYAKVNGRSYAIKSGQYYLFTGKMSVTLGTKNPGSMGQWSVCITSDRAPVSGNGNNRPKSPCEAEKKPDARGKGNK